MASCHSRGESVAGGSAAQPADAMAMSISKLVQSPDTSSVAEWRSREQMEPSPPSTSPAYWDTDDDEDASNSSSMTGPKPTDLYGKFTWKIENFSEISKRELRSNVFEVGGYKWYILVYPQGCDVCNHLSLFLCVADYDKLLPGWSHFAQFTIAVVNKDPKKSKYSDTLHRFCKKEHDWGWKKFMELTKVLDGFTVADTLVIKAQVQVIRENPNRPFRCLDCQYRRELVRVYLTNVEGICRRFVEEKREKLGKLMEDAPRWASFRAFWSAVEDSTRRRLAREKTDVILKAVVKRFFNEKEVTSTLVMDALYSGCKALDYRSRNKKGKNNGVDMEEVINPLVCVDKDAFVLTGDVLSLLERAVSETLPPYKDDKGPQNRTKDGSSGEDFGKDSVEQDEQRLTELGRRTVEMFVLTHLYTNRVEVSYREAVALRRQEELIREEEAAGQAETELRAKREAAEKEKRSKKKQAKQRRKDRKEKDKEAEEKRVRVEQESRQRPSDVSRSKERLLKERNILLLTPADVGDEEDDLSGLDTVDDVIVGTFGPATEYGDVDRTSWEREGPYSQSGMEDAGFSGAVLEEGSTRNGRIGRKHQAAILDDSSSTCSTDSLPSVRPCMNGSCNSGPSVPEHNHTVASRARNRGDSEGYENGRFIEAESMDVSGRDASGPGEPSSSCSSAGVDSETVILSLKERVQWLEQRLSEKDEEVVMLQEQVSLFQHQMGLDRPFQCRGPSDDSVSGPKSGPTSTTCSVHGDEIRSDTSKTAVPIEDAETPGFRGIGSSKAVPTLNGNTSLSIEIATPSNGMLLSHSDNFGDNSGSGYSLYTGKVDVSKAPAVARNRGNEASRAPRIGIPPFAGGGSSVPRTPLGAEDTGLSTGISQPMSAPGPVASQRPGVQGQPPLSRSLSAAARLVLGSETSSGVHSNGNTHHSPPVTPSYRNAAAGKIRGSAGLPAYSVPGAGSFGGAGPAPVLAAANSSVYSNTSTPILQAPPHQGVSPAVSSTAVALASSPSLTTPLKVFQGSMQGSLGGKVEPAASPPATMVHVPPVHSAPESLTHSLSQQEGNSNHGSVGGRRAPVGITFGTVTPEMLQQKQEQEQKQEQLQLQLQRKEEQALLQQQPSSFPEDSVDHSNQNAEVLHENGIQQHLHADTHQHPIHQNDKGGLNGVRHASAVVSLMESVNNGGIMGEEFPHLDIINDLLEDDQSFSMALNAMLQHPGAAPFNGHHLRMFGYSDMHKLNHYGQLRSDGVSAVNGVGVDGSDRGRMVDEDRSHMHGVDGNPLNMRDSRRMTSSFSHQPLGQLHTQHSGHLDGVASHYWPITSAGIPAGINNVRNGFDTQMGYPLVQTHHSSVPDFSMGHSGYSGYSPAQQL